MVKKAEDSGALRCPSCGGVQHQDRGEQFFCEYCGSPLAGGVEGVPPPAAGDAYRDWREERADLPDWLEGTAGTGWVEADAPAAGAEPRLESPPEPSPRRRSGTGCNILLAIAILMGLSCLCCGIVFSLTDQRARLPGGVQLPGWMLQEEGVVYVSASEWWGDTGTMVRNGDIVSIDYLDGAWTVRGGAAGIRSQTGPNGFQGEYLSVGVPLPSAPVGALVGRIGDGKPFMVGNGTRFLAGQEGTLKLMINDLGLEDNTGALKLKVEVTSSQ